MNYTIGWRDKTVTVNTGTEAAAALQQIAADTTGPFLIQVGSADSPDVGIELIYGCTDRAMLMYADESFGGWAFDPDLPLAAEDLDYDYGSVEPDRTRLTAAQASRAVTEFIDTGTRPSGLSWLDEHHLASLADTRDNA